MDQFYGDNDNEDYDDITLPMQIIVAGKPDQFRLLYKSNFETQVIFLGSKLEYQQMNIFGSIWWQ